MSDNRPATRGGTKWNVLVRLMVGAVFLSEGIQKFLDPAARGAGRFAKIGLPEPEFLGTFVGSFEIACGTLVLLGLVIRLAAVPLITIMLVALATTKWPILQNEGFWKAAHESRTDWSMLLGSLFLLCSGGGPWSIDRLLFGGRMQGKTDETKERPASGLSDRSAPTA